ncbi:MAG: hypothetical protein ACYS1A_12250 [Planctomycetota bacterium]
MKKRITITLTILTVLGVCLPVWGQPWDGGGDGIVNFLDWAVFAEGWQITNDIFDLADFAEQWLKTGTNYYIADIAPAPVGDKIVNMLDFAVFAENWLKGVE